ncbi:endonuclease/exonuclease/phosphatase family protein [Intrasporangium calvum]|uniref:Endonuclease/exonuclease/phosphatase n=1 Tax=Intrasporangium calvum (strain ATCC 23552 / DSM 43043 / JCM 3097 / NBRC 12989 / NCIMB 10167 / NRRL B-3866 / 7 KIP) TaxID=710696 RepID=E6SBX3_INTC7|nr:endonuclease/exonuclease/phosphatase family protein [Intrasporangium calvum]ADU48482.1 Endonuclease/exonuclease/phosphatase [Intrasporangium calvum DSM 43043]AXG13502.1 endonuclease/exonuclease/phosphatase [Intrasporangium calvum]
MTGARPHDALRVMSYNVQDLTADRAAAARVVRAVRPDVLCLQEVPRRLTTELRLPSFARECGLYWSGGRLGTGGTAILTALKARVHATGARRLPVRLPDRSRGLASARVSLPGQPPVTVISVHLSLRAEERVRHADLILSEPLPRTVLAGDLNEGVDGRAHTRFAAHFSLASGGWPTFPSDRPRAALDVIFASADLATVEPAAAELDELDAADLAAASDHRPVWVDVLPDQT